MAFLLATFGACQPKEPTTYTIHGEISGDANGKEVFLYPIMGEVALDSAINANPEEEKGSQQGFKQSYFYLENGDIQYIADIDSMPSLFRKPNMKMVLPIVKGSKSQDLYETYSASIKDLNAKYRTLDEEYGVDFHQPAMKGVFNTERGIGLQKQMDSVVSELEKTKRKFIHEHADSRVAFDMVENYFHDMFVTLTAEEIDEMMNVLKPSWNGTELYTELEKMAESARMIAIGSTFTDVTLLDDKGNSVKLSDYIQPDKYTLVEFWATWCGPCRAEIPHLKHVYEEYKDKNFNIINISFDDTTTEWQKTMKEEGMTWTQLIDPQHFEGEAAQKYRILGIPYSILLDPNGKIIGTDMRGAKLDLALHELIP